MNRGIWLIAIVAPAAFCGACFAVDKSELPPAQYGMPDIRSGGVLEDAYYYHRLGPMRSAIERGGIPHANGGYNYGFPMQSYRYGWFGAEHNYPRVGWRDSYYGESVRTSYRRRY